MSSNIIDINSAKKHSNKRVGIRDVIESLESELNHPDFHTVSKVAEASIIDIDLSLTQFIGFIKRAKKASNNVNKKYDELLHLYLDVKTKQIKDAKKHIDIMKIAFEFGSDCPQLKKNAIEAIKNGTSPYMFKKHALNIHSMKNKDND